jgi:hypothetical protein
LQFIVSFLIELLAWFPLEWVRVNTFLLILSGLILGAISLSIFPQPFVSNDILRNLNLLFTPFFLAWFVQWMEPKILRFKKDQENMYTFWNVYAFALCFALARYLS